MPAPLLFKAFIGSMTDHISKWNNNFTLIEAAFVDIYQQLTAIAGEGARLILDAFDRPGIVGEASYRLDIDGYSGGSQITVGRRPVADPLLGDTDISVAWINTGSAMLRVELDGDVVINAAAILTGLPKTIYVGIPSTGVPQFYEDTLTPGVLYVYSMTWDGFQLTTFKRLGTLLPGYSTLQAGIAAPRMIGIFDGETDFIGDIQGSTSIVLPGAADDNGIDVDGSMEVVGFYAAFSKNGPDGMYAPSGPDNRIRFKIVSNGVTWTESDFEFDCSMVADEVFRRVAGGVGDDKFVTTVRRFDLERTFKGAHVASARAFTWGLIVRPLLGAPMPKDTTRVSQI
jgi:hypothetical protein